MFQRAGRSRDAAREIEIEQKILAESAFRLQPVPFDDLAQGRQAIGREQAFVQAARSRRGGVASRPASRKAAIRLAGRARPVPAISKAVPWSGEVRRKGKPSVTLTASSKASVLIGIKAWSWYIASAAS